MDTLGVEETLLTYYRTTGKSNHYTIIPVDQLPKDAIDIRSVCINNIHIKYCEEIIIEPSSSTIFWMLEGS